MNRKELVTVTKATVKEFGKDDIGYLAAALTYYAFFSIFPLILLAIILVGIFVSNSQDATDFVLSSVGKVLPGSVDLLKGVLTEAFKDRSNAGWTALIGVITLIFSASGAFDALDKSINRAWGSEKVPTFVVSKLTSFALMLLIAALLVISFVVSIVLTGARTLASAFGQVPGEQVFWQFANLITSVAIITLAFLLIYRFLPRCDINLRDVWPAALLAAIVWTLIKEGFALFLGSSFARFDATYGTLGTVFALLTWIYLSSLVILTGAEFSSETARVRRLRPKPEDEQAKQSRRSSPWLPARRT